MLHLLNDLSPGREGNLPPLPFVEESSDRALPVFLLFSLLVFCHQNPPSKSVTFSFGKGAPCADTQMQLGGPSMLPMVA